MTAITQNGFNLMNHSDFEIGKDFVLDGCTYLCTDKGTRIVAAIRVDSLMVGGSPGSGRILSREQAESDGWFHGPPYAVEEILLDEYDQEACEPV